MNDTKEYNLAKIIQQLPENELRSFIRKIIHEPVVEKHFMETFHDYFADACSADACICQIDDAYFDFEYGYDFSGGDRNLKLSCKIDEVLRLVDVLGNRGNVEAAIEICFAILIRNVEIMNACDDSYGYLSSIMNGTLDRLNAWVDEKHGIMDEEARKGFMDYCWLCIQKQYFKGWEWHTTMYHYLCRLSHSEDEFAKLIEFMEHDSCLAWEYGLKRRMLLKREILIRWKGRGAAELFTLQNLQIPELREQAILDALSKDDFQQSYQLCREGLLLEDEEYSQYFLLWNRYLLETAKKDGNDSIIVEAASELYVWSYDSDVDYYQILKATVAPGMWNRFVLDLAERARTSNVERYADVCIREGWTGKLYEYLKEEQSINTVIRYESYLLPDYRDFLINRYLDYACGLMNSNNRNRQTYQYMCEFLRRASSIGGHEKVCQTKEFLRMRYKACRALLDELSKI